MWCGWMWCGWICSVGHTRMQCWSHAHAVLVTHACSVGHTRMQCWLHPFLPSSSFILPSSCSPFSVAQLDLGSTPTGIQSRSWERSRSHSLARRGSRDSFGQDKKVAADEVQNTKGATPYLFLVSGLQMQKLISIYTYSLQRLVSSTLCTCSPAR
jgi:hypothetical protein